MVTAPGAPTLRGHLASSIGTKAARWKPRGSAADRKPCFYGSPIQYRRRTEPRGGAWRVVTAWRGAGALVGRGLWASTSTC